MTVFVRKNMQNSQKNKIAYRLQLLITIQNGKHNENSYLVLIVFFSPPRLRHRPPIPITHLRKFFKVLPRNTFLEPVTQKIIHPHMQTEFLSEWNLFHFIVQKLQPSTNFRETREEKGNFLLQTRRVGASLLVFILFS